MSLTGLEQPMGDESSSKHLPSTTGSTSAESAVKRRGWVSADFFTHNYRVSGAVDVRRLPLADQLNDRTTSYLMLEDAYVSPIDRPGDITASYAIAALRKENVTMAVLVSKEDGMSKKQSYGSYYGTSLKNVFITVPQFEVRGFLRTVGKFDLHALLATGTDRFMPLLDSTTFASLKPEIQFDGGMILVNKDAVGVMCVQEDE
jgi:hypothetical protein